MVTFLSRCSMALVDIGRGSYIVRTLSISLNRVAARTKMEILEKLEKWPKFRAWRECGYIEIGDNCWLWSGPLGGDGYARTTYGNKQYRIHRLLYLMGVGKIPRGKKHLHHTCRNRNCVNPAHLEPVTPKEHKERHLTWIVRINRVFPSQNGAH